MLYQDQLIGIIGPIDQIWGISLCYCLFWIINGIIILWQSPYYYDTTFNYISLVVIIMESFIIMVIHIALMKKRLSVYVNQIIPEEDPKQRSYPRSPIVKSPQRNTLMSMQSARKSTRIVPTGNNTQQNFSNQIFLINFAMMSHGVLFIHQICNIVDLNPTFSLHLIQMVILLSSSVINIYMTVITFTIQAHIIISKEFFFDYYEKFQVLTYCISNNFFELFVITLNLSLVIGSLIGIIFISDITSTVLFYFYLGIICLYVLLQIVVYVRRGMND
ncbi:hypothetical protein pb186bvf_003458 [Paramecium bursaria]